MEIVVKNAVISACGLYRYSLTRSWSTGPGALFIMLNPSVADANIDDPTVKKCMKFARREGMGSLTVVNLFALRSTYPEDLYTAEDPVGPENDKHLEEEIRFARSRGGLVVAAWGKHGEYKNRSHEVIHKFGPFKALVLNQDGSPRHPLYIPDATKFIDLW